MKKHFFVIDDDEDEVYLINAALHGIRIKYECTWVNIGEQALEQLWRQVPDVIILNLNMSGMNAFKCLQLIKRVPEFSHIPVILHASRMTDEIRWWGMQLGAFDCLKKTAMLDRMVPLIGKAMREYA